MFFSCSRVRHKKHISQTRPKLNNPCVYLPSLLELSLPQFSLSLTNDMRDLLANMNPEIEAKLLGSEAEFSQLSSASPFRVDQVRRRAVRGFNRLHAVVFSVNCLCVTTAGGRQGCVWDVWGGRSFGKDPNRRRSSGTFHQPSVLLCRHGGTI